MPKQTVITSRHSSGTRGSVATYCVGFVLSVGLTLAAYFLVKQFAVSLPDSFLIIAVLVLAIIQLIVQLQFFIHLGHDSKPYWNKLMFALMLLFVLIVGIGSIWIMNNLHYNVMSPSETETYIIEEERISR